MTEMYFIRHGFSTGNRDKVFYGHYNGSLDPKGHEQAKCVAEFFGDINLDAIYSSDLIRSMDTARPTAESKSMEIVPDVRLREIFAGEWENKHVSLLVSGKYEKDYEVWKNDIAHSRCTGGESVEELRERIFAAVKDIAIKNDGKSVAVFTHATPIKVLRSSFLGEPIDKVNEYGWVPNASVSKVIYDSGNWNIVFYGESKHLESLVTTLDPAF